MPEQPLIVFDVNETLLDLDATRPSFDRVFRVPAAMRLRFANLITYSEALTLAGAYVSFTDADAAELTDRFATMPPHPEVPAAPHRLRDHGFRLFSLTDNTLAISGRQLERAGVIGLFQHRPDLHAIADQLIRRYPAAAEASRPGHLPGPAAAPERLADAPSRHWTARPAARQPR